MLHITAALVALRLAEADLKNQMAISCPGFIWGGEWCHSDTMHLEYRPELLDKRCSR